MSRSNFVYDVRKHRAWYLSLFSGVTLLAISYPVRRWLPLELRWPYTGIALVGAFLFFALMTCEDVPDQIKFCWWDLKRTLLCTPFGCDLRSGWGGGGMLVPEAECVRCNTMCGNIHRPLFHGPAWRRRV